MFPLALILPEAVILVKGWSILDAKIYDAVAAYEAEVTLPSRKDAVKAYEAEGIKPSNEPVNEPVKVPEVEPVIVSEPDTVTS